MKAIEGKGEELGDVVLLRGPGEREEAKRRRRRHLLLSISSADARAPRLGFHGDGQEELGSNGNDLRFQIYSFPLVQYPSSPITREANRGSRSMRTALVRRISQTRIRKGPIRPQQTSSWPVELKTGCELDLSS